MRRSVDPRRNVARISSFRTFVLAAATTLAFVPSIAAQTPATALGLGYPVTPLDARAASMGGTGLGLSGGSLSARNPADLAVFARPTLGLTFAPEAVSVKAPSEDQSTGRSRVAIVQAAVPVDEWTIGLGFAASLDQDWGVRLQDTLQSSFGTYPYEERREHDGGVSEVTLGVIRDFGRLAAGIDGSLRVGSLRQTFFRNFEPALEDPQQTIGIASGEARFSWSGFRVRGGAAAEIGSRFRLSGVVGWSSDLKASQDTADQSIEEYRFSMPFEWAIGGSAQLTTGLLATAAVGYQSWSSTTDDLSQTAADDVLWYGAGIEYVGSRCSDRAFRCGPAYAGPTCRSTGRHGAADETAATLGFGIKVAGGRASFDFGAEFGSRGDLAASGVEESFRRLSISMSLFQF